MSRQQLCILLNLLISKLDFMIILIGFQYFLFYLSYREILSHDNVTFNSNGTVTSNPSHPLVWDEERSIGHKEDDLFVLPNIALLVSIIQC